jgi:hypothetical protein
MLQQPRTADTRPLASRVVVRSRPRGVTVALGAVAALIALVIVLLATAGGGGTSRRSPALRPSSPAAPLSEQLRRLDQAINHSSR